MRFMISAGPGDNQPNTQSQHLAATAQSEHANQPLDEKMFAAYMKFNEDMHRAGVLVTSEGLTPGGKGARVGISGGKRTVLDGPFAESKELLGGFYVLDVKSLDEAISWALRCPMGLGTDNVLEIRPLTAMEEIPAELLKLSAAVAPSWTASVTKPAR